MKMKGKSGIVIRITALALLAGTAAFAAMYDESGGLCVGIRKAN